MGYDNVATVSFSAKCPNCYKISKGIIERCFCIGGDGGFLFSQKKITGLVQNECEHCGYLMGLRIKLVGSSAEVFEIGAFLQMREKDMHDIAKELRVKQSEKDLDTAYQEMNRRGSYFTELLRKNQGEAALNEFIGMVEYRPLWTQAHFAIMEYAVKREFLGNPISLQLVKAIKENPKDPQLYYADGILLQTIGDNQAAIADYEKAIKLKSDFAVAYHNLAVAHNLKNPVKAVELWQTALRLEPMLAESHFALAAVFMRLGRKNEGLESFRKFIPLAYRFLDDFKKHAVQEIRILESSFHAGSK